MQKTFRNWQLSQQPLDEYLKPGDTVDHRMLKHFIGDQHVPFTKIVQMAEATDVIDGKPIFDTLYQEDECSPWIYQGQCYKRDSQNRNPALMPMVYICSRYRAGNQEQLEFNIEVAMWAAGRAVRHGMIPIAPHLYFTRFLDDDIPEERFFGMEAGKRLMQHCKTFHVITVDDVVSEGMKAEIEYMTEVLMIKGTCENFTEQEMRGKIPIYQRRR